MDPEEIARKWVWYGIEDLYFAFCIDYLPHKPYALFAEIMGLEKILKAFLLFKSRHKYVSLSKEDAYEIIDCLVKRWGHSIKRMLREISNLMGNDSIKKVKEGEYDGYKGSELVKAIEAGYMESRYPVSRPIYEQFKIKGFNLYHDPLESSGTTKFMYELCRTVLAQLRAEVDLKPIGTDFIRLYSARESAQRFINLMFNGNIGTYL